MRCRFLYPSDLAEMLRAWLLLCSGCPGILWQRLQRKEVTRDLSCFRNYLGGFQDITTSTTQGIIYYKTPFPSNFRNWTCPQVSVGLGRGNDYFWFSQCGLDGLNIYFSQFWRLESPRSRCQQNRCLVWTCFLACRQPPSCCICPCMAERDLSSSKHKSHHL